MSTNLTLPIPMDDRTNNAPFWSNPWFLFSLGAVVLGGTWVATTAHGSGHPFSGWSGYILAQLLTVTVFTDLAARKIHNWATYSAFLWAVGLNFAAWLLPGQESMLGAVGLQQSLCGGFGLLAIMFVIFSISGGGAGDVKMSAAIGALLGWNLAVDAMLYGFIVAGAGLLCFTIWVHGPVFIVKTVARTIGHKLLPVVVDAPEKKQSELMKRKFPLAPFFAVGTLLAVYWHAAV